MKEIQIFQKDIGQQFILTLEYKFKIAGLSVPYEKPHHNYGIKEALRKVWGWANDSNYQVTIF